jgi:hypothetical protein
MDLNETTKLYTYTEFNQLTVQLFEQGKATGHAQNTAKLDATKINLTRIKRWNKTFKISAELDAIIKAIKEPMKWFVITEGWCGDSAQILPLIAKIADSSPKIELNIILRDDNPEIMQAYLTNGGEAIPKLIATNDNHEDLFTFGPRPSLIQQKVQDYKKEFTLNDRDEFNKNLHLWYARDKAYAFQADMMRLLS